MLWNFYCQINSEEMQWRLLVHIINQSQSDLANLVRIDDTTPTRIAISHLPLTVHHHIADKELLACTSHGHIKEASFFLFNK